MGNLNPFAKKYGKRTEEEIANLERLKQMEQDSAYRKKISEENKIKQEKQYYEQKQAYSQTPQAKIGKGIQGLFAGIQRFGRPAQAQQYYRQQGQLAPRSMTVPGQRSLGKGRPRGTYDKRYAAYGGVFGFRKALALQNREARLNMMRQNTVTPQQEQVLQRYNQQQQMQRVDPERQVIPDSYGIVNLKKIMQDIDDSSRLVD